MAAILKKSIIKWTIVALILILPAGCSKLPAPSSDNTKNPISQSTVSTQKHTETSTPSPAYQNTGISNPPTVSTTPEKNNSQNTNKSIVYENSKFGFNFTLPESWNGYTIIENKWEGITQEDQQGKTINITGPMISIRHPLWTSKNQRQDIPIMIFTLTQWKSLQQGNFHIGAAPIGPSELGRNSRYVFALPARYNYAFPTGFEEVETILKSKPLHPTENFTIAK